MFDIEIFNGLLEFYYHAYLFSMFSVRDFHPCPNKYFITIIILKYRSCTIDFGTSYRTHFNFFTTTLGDFCQLKNQNYPFNVFKGIY